MKTLARFLAGLGVTIRGGSIGGEVVVAFGLLAALGASAVAADQTVQERIGRLFGSRDANRVLVTSVGLITLAYFAHKIRAAERAERPRAYYAGVWIAGMATVSGLVGILPSIPALETVQQVNLLRLDPLAQASLQWGAFWTFGVLLLAIFTGPHVNLGHGVLIWLLGLIAGLVIAGTLPESAAPPLVALPIAAIWATIVYIGAVYGVAPGPADLARRTVAQATRDEERSTEEAGRSAPLTRSVWASLALVLLALGLAEFASYVTLDRQVNADHTVTRQAVEDVLARLDQVDLNISNVSRALRLKLDPTQAYADTQNSIAEVNDLVAAAIGAAELTGPTIPQSANQQPADPGQATAVPTPSSGQPPVLTRSERAALALQRLRRANDALYQLLPRFALATPATLDNSDQIALLLNQDVRPALASTRREARLTREILIGADLPTAGVFTWVAAMFAALVLLPWVLFVLFLLQKRESRAREVLIDLCLLDGSPPPRRRLDAPYGSITPGSLLDRVLGEGFSSPRRASQIQDGPSVRQVQSALVERAFAEQEYLVGLLVLTVIVAAGWYSVFYPRGGVGLAETISQGADAWQLWDYLRSGLTPLTAGFAGGFFWCIYALVRRYLDSDLYPAAFLQCSVQLVLGFILSMMVSIAVPPVAELAGTATTVVAAAASGLGSHAGVAASPVAAASFTPPAVQAITILLAFVGGLSLSAGFTQLLGLLRLLVAPMRLTTAGAMVDQARLTDLEGIDIWTEARLAEEGVENVQALAHAPLQRLVLRTHFTTQRIVDWIDQALLYVHTANWPPVPGAVEPAAVAGPSSAGQAPAPSGDVNAPSDLYTALRRAGIRNGTALLAAGGWLTTAASVNLNEAEERGRYLQVALGRVLKDQPAAVSATLFTVCQALIDSPNWVHVANYRRANRDLFADATRQWIERDNPPLAPLPGDPPASAAPADVSRQLHTESQPVANGTSAVLSPPSV